MERASQPLAASLRATCPMLDAQTLDDIVQGFRRMLVARGESLLRQGELWRSAIWIEKGAVRLYFTRRDGREFNKNFYLEGALICPLTPAMWGEPSLFDMSTLEAGVIWRADAGHLRERLAACGVWPTLRAEFLSRLVTQKLQREHDLLALDGRRRYEAFCVQHPQLAARIPLHQLASYLGLTDVSLSRIRHRATGSTAPG
jgi:CRP-like cAMP-binding protein